MFLFRFVCDGIYFQHEVMPHWPLPPSPLRVELCGTEAPVSSKGLPFRLGNRLNLLCKSLSHPLCCAQECLWSALSFFLNSRGARQPRRRLAPTRPLREKEKASLCFPAPQCKTGICTNKKFKFYFWCRTSSVRYTEEPIVMTLANTNPFPFAFFFVVFLFWYCIIAAHT